MAGCSGQAICAVPPRPPGRRGFGRWGITSDALHWLTGLEAAYQEARELEERELEAQEGKGEGWPLWRAGPASCGKQGPAGCAEGGHLRTDLQAVGYNARLERGGPGERSQGRARLDRAAAPCTAAHASLHACLATQACIAWHHQRLPAPSLPKITVSAVKAMLGRRVQAALDDVEKQLHGELTQLDRYVGEQHAAAGCRQLAREQHSWERAQVAAGSGDDGRGSAGNRVSAAEAAVVAGGVKVLWDLLKLLPDFRRKTLLAQVGWGRLRWGDPSTWRSCMVCRWPSHLDPATCNTARHAAPALLHRLVINLCSRFCPPAPSCCCSTWPCSAL